MNVKKRNNYHNLSPQQKLEIRRIAVRKYNKGESTTLITEQYGITRQTLYNWLDAHESDPDEGLLLEKQGRKPKLDDDQIESLRKILLKGASEFGYQSDLWNCGRIAAVIKKQFGVELTPSTVGRILKKRLNFTYQMPRRRAQEGDQKKIKHYRRYVFPQLKQRALKAGKTIVFQDESSISMQPLAVRTWAPAGQTPEIVERFNWQRLSLSAALTHTGKLLFQLIPGSYNSERIIEFLKMLLREIEGEIALFWDGASIHRSRAVKEFLKRPEVHERLSAHSLVAYAPEMNPVEYLFSPLKKSDLGNYAPTDLKELYKTTTEALRKRSNRKDLVYSHIRASKLGFKNSEFV